MSESILNPVDLRTRGFEALVKALGWLDAVRFIQQFDLGHGNYTEERRDFLPDWDVETLVHRAAGMVREKSVPRPRTRRKQRRRD